MFQPYDVTKFVREVEQLLQEQGAEPQRQSDPRPDVAAGMLLRSFGLSPSMDHVEALRQSMDAPWPEKDEERARRFTDQDE